MPYLQKCPQKHGKGLYHLLLVPVKAQDEVLNLIEKTFIFSILQLFFFFSCLPLPSTHVFKPQLVRAHVPVRILAVDS